MTRIVLPEETGAEAVAAGSVGGLGRLDHQTNTSAAIATVMPAKTSGRRQRFETDAAEGGETVASTPEASGASSVSVRVSSSQRKP